MKGEATKRKSQKRFEQLNRIIDDIAPTLPSASHLAVLLICFRHGRQAGFFRASTKRIAKSARLSERHVKRIINDLETAGVVRLEAEHNGPIPRSYRITGQTANGDTHVTIKEPSNGDAHVTINA
ncbi:helix-turn-helix domain-containing protein [Stieleria sp. TO1_6]|uniref:helix-turn-helix domain-containing protein n=1 Tax=Stieleria tagensis TaxID=2956795 RepID=UPI00209AF6B2|nr:helix-turn-helix domain-containing protein [Stieleria tagensis]MCO8121457.1 helix-turn-helix domain-containing protein [Stieleria tagensis]